MATYNTIVVPSRILNNGGEQTRQQYSGDNSNTWKRGQLLELDANGLITEVVDNASAVEIDTADFRLSGGNIMFIALDDVTAATSGTVAVQRITSDTEFIGPLVSGASTSAPPTAVASMIGGTEAGDNYVLWQSTDGWFALDKNDTTNPIVVVTGIESVDMPYNWDDIGVNMFVHSADDPQKYNFVRFKFLPSVISDL